MHTVLKQTIVLAVAAALVQQARSQNAPGLLNESGSAILAPSLAPTGGYAVNPQEYLQVSWSVVENASDVYTYSYTLQNPANDVLLNNDGTLTSSPEQVEAFSLSFNTAAPGAYISGSQTGGAFREVNNNDLAWFFSPAVSPGGGANVSFQSDLAPGEGDAAAQGASPPGPWSSVSPNGQTLPVPSQVLIAPEPSTIALLVIPALLGLAFLRKPQGGQIKAGF